MSAQKHYYKSNLTTSNYLALAALTLVFILASDLFLIQVKRKDYSKKLEASELALEAQLTLRNENFDLIGEEISVITTDLGDSLSKQVSTNPNFAAAFVQMFDEIGIKRGDTVSVAITGSFPAINIAFYSACKVSGVYPIVITSVGASQWGANKPDETWLDFEKFFNEKGIFPYKSIAASIGGKSDIARDLSEEGKNILFNTVQGHGTRFIKANSIVESARERVAIFDSVSSNVKAFVNIGGGVASLGVGNSKFISPGVNLDLFDVEFPKTGALTILAERGLPIIHISEIVDLEKRYGLKEENYIIPRVGKGEIFETIKYNLIYLAPFALLYWAILFFLLNKFRNVAIKKASGN